MSAIDEFTAAIESFARRGWWMAKCEHKNNRELLFYISFHVHPDDTKVTMDKVTKAIEAIGAKDRWLFSEVAPGRFFLNPIGLSGIDDLQFNESDLAIAKQANEELFRIAEVVRASV